VEVLGPFGVEELITRGVKWLFVVVGALVSVDLARRDVLITRLSAAEDLNSQTKCNTNWTRCCYGTKLLFA